MPDERYELLSVEQMRQRYGLVAENRPPIHLDQDNVPPNLRHLLAYAEFWGVGDDLIRDDMIRKAPPAAIADLKRVIAAHEDALDEWLAGPEAENPEPSPEFLAFSAMRMAADFA